jgi:hypothetical protein
MDSSENSYPKKRFKRQSWTPEEEAFLQQQLQKILHVSHLSLDELYLPSGKKIKKMRTASKGSTILIADIKAKGTEFYFY